MRGALHGASESAGRARRRGTMRRAGAVQAEALGGDTRSRLAETIAVNDDV